MLSWSIKLSVGPRALGPRKDQHAIALHADQPSCVDREVAQVPHLQLTSAPGSVQVITQLDEHGHKLEPYEEAVVEVPEAHMGGVVDLMGSRKGQMQDMSASAEGLNRVTYRIPTRGLLGLRNAILTATKVWALSLSLLLRSIFHMQQALLAQGTDCRIGSRECRKASNRLRRHSLLLTRRHAMSPRLRVQGTAVLNTVFKEYGAWSGELNTRELGSLVAWETGAVTGYALESAQQRGRMFVAPGEEVYENMVRPLCPRCPL